MKTVETTGGEIVRLTDDEAKVRVQRGEARYVPKAAWKALRPAGAPKEVQHARSKRITTKDQQANAAANAAVILEPAPVPELDLTLEDQAEILKP